MKKLINLDTEFNSSVHVRENLKGLKSMFPEAFSEDRIDFEILRQVLSGDLDESEERFGLNWYGKSRARQLAMAPSTGTLRPCIGHDVDQKTTQNLLIEGDNLEVLKIMQKSYSRKVKLIYIDPPYNTGKDFIYPDDYQDNLANYLRVTGQVDGENRTLSSNTETSGRFHTDWLNMIFPRLKLARNFLSDDGIIVVSISDSEVHNLRSCLEEIFGVENFLGCVLWNSTKSVTNTALISVSHTYNLIYARNRDYFVSNRSHFRLPEYGEGFTNPDDDPRGPWKADPFEVGGERPNQMYPITNPRTGKTYLPKRGNSWKNELKIFEQLMAEDRIVFGVSGEAGPQRKRFQEEAEQRGRVAKTWWDDVDTTTNATKALNNLMGADVFNNPKPTSLIQRFIQLGTHDPTNSPIVMDFFAGSGSTAEAVIHQNILDGGNRRFILIQLPEPINPSESSQKIAAEYLNEIGRPLTISELTKERLRRVAQTLKAENSKLPGDVDFSVFKLDSSNFRTWEPEYTDLENSLLANIEHLKPDRNEQDILYELVLKLGLDLSVSIDLRSFAGKSVYSVGKGVLLACLAEEIDRKEVESLTNGITEWYEELSPTLDTTVVFRDGAFTDDVAKLNVAAILQQSGIQNIRSI